MMRYLLLLIYFSCFHWAQWTLKSHLSAYLSASVTVTVRQLLSWHYFQHTKVKEYFKENILWHGTTGRSRETVWLAFFKCVIPWLFFCLYSRCVLTSKEMLHLSWTALDSVTSFSLMLHSCIVPQRAFGAWKNAFKSYIILLFSIFPLSMAHLPLMSRLSSRHIFCFCIRRGNNSDGRRDLPADLLIIHHSLFVATIRSGWVSSSNLRI